MERLREELAAHHAPKQRTDATVPDHRRIASGGIIGERERASPTPLAEAPLVVNVHGA